MNKINEKKYNRSLKNILINPKTQLRYAVVAVSYAFLGMSLVQIFSLRKLNEIQSTLESDNNYWFVNYVLYVSWVYIGGLVVVGIFAFLYSLFVSHKTAGPQVSLLNHIKELSLGNYKSRVQLRKNDDLVELSDALNSLAENLEKKI